MGRARIIAVDFEEQAGYNRHKCEHQRQLSEAVFIDVFDAVCVYVW